MATDDCRWEEEGLAPTTTRYRLVVGGAAVSWRGFAEGLCGASPELRNALTTVLASSPHGAFYWETPAVTGATTGRAFEMVTVAAPRLAQQRAHPDAFAAKFAAEKSVVCFANLGGDARLVVPCPVGPQEAYAHLARFVRDGPREQVDTLWRRVGEALIEWWSTPGATPVWLSTSGGGVPWLHVRLDRRPKYYSHAPYRTGA